MLNDTYNENLTQILVHQKRRHKNFNLQINQYNTLPFSFEVTRLVNWQEY